MWPYKKKAEEDWTSSEESHMKTKVENGVMLPQTKDYLELPEVWENKISVVLGQVYVIYHSRPKQPRGTHWKEQQPIGQKQLKLGWVLPTSQEAHKHKPFSCLKEKELENPNSRLQNGEANLLPKKMLHIWGETTGNKNQIE